MTKLLRFCLYLTVLSVSAALFHRNCFPNLPFLHKLTRFEFASVLLFIKLPPVAGEHSLSGKTILIVSDIYIKTQLVYPYRPAMVVTSSSGEYSGAFIRVAMLY